MKTIKRILLALCVIIIFALIAGLFLIRGVKYGALPEYEGEIICT